MANINRVVLVGQPDPRPRAPPHAERHRRLQPPPRREHAPQGRRDRRVDREAELLRHHRLGQPGRELRPVPREGPAGRDRRPARVARVGGAGRHQAPGRSRSSPTPCSSSAGATAAAARRRRRQPVRAGGRAAAARTQTSAARRPTTTFRSDVGGHVAGKNNDGRSRKRTAAPDRGPAQVVLLLQVEGRRDRLQEHRRASPLHLREGQDPLAPDQRRLPPPPAPGRGRGQARPRDGAAARTSPRAATTVRAAAAVAIAATAGTGSDDAGRLRQDVESLGLRGEVVNVARGYARNYLLPRGLAELATPGLVQGARAARRAARTPRGADERRGAVRSPRGSRRPSSASTSSAGPTGSLFGSVTATNVVDRLWDDAEDPRSTAASSMSARSSGSAATPIPVEVFGDVTAELRLARRPRRRRASARGGARGRRGAEARRQPRVPATPRRPQVVGEPEPRSPRRRRGRA